jgi:hypothetical protein
LYFIRSGLEPIFSKFALQWCPLIGLVFYWVRSEAYIFRGPQRTLETLHGRGRVACSNRSRAAAVEWEELLGKQRGEAVDANGDIEACLSAGDHDTDRDVPRLRGTASPPTFYPTMRPWGTLGGPGHGPLPAPPAPPGDPPPSASSRPRCPAPGASLPPPDPTMWWIAPFGGPPPPCALVAPAPSDPATWWLSPNGPPPSVPVPPAPRAPAHPSGPPAPPDPARWRYLLDLACLFEVPLLLVLACLRSSEHMGRPFLLV